MNNKPSRQQQRKVHKLTHWEIDHLIQKHYKRGLDDGKNISDNVDFRIWLSQVLNNTPGIGPKRYENIMKVAKEIKL